jgi:hypothetical protein
VAVTVVLSTDQTLDPGDAALPPVTRPLKLKPGLSKAVPVKISAFPAVPEGTYYLLARASSASAGDSDVAVSATTITVAAPFRDLVPTFVASPTGARTPGGRGVARLSVMNQGNVTASGALSVTLLAEGPGGQSSLGSFDARLNLKPGKSKLLKLRFVLPTAGGEYTLKAVVGSTEITDANASNNTATSASFTISG